MPAPRTRSAGGASAPKPINLALQGGGSHGAFTWGVLDRLLEDGRVNIDGICGTSAGAMNAVLVAHGLVVRKGQPVRQLLEELFMQVGLLVIILVLQF